MEQQDYLSEDVINQLKNLSSKFHDLTNEQKALVDKLIVNDKLRERYQRDQLCDECYHPNTDLNYCHFCNSKRLQENFKNWTSENNEIDTVIQESQIQATCATGILEWVEHDRFYDIEFLAKGGFGTVYKAKWKDGYITSWDSEHKRWNRYTDEKVIDGQEKHKVVALKILNNSQNISSDFLQEIKLHQTMNNVLPIINLYGMSKDPETNNYIIIMKLAENGSLRNYLDRRTISWDQKLYLLREISNGLNEIHDKELVHRDFHPGNIVVTGDLEDLNVRITDLGLNKPPNVNYDNKQLFGILPYLAPEVLNGNNYTQGSDIYSFGMVTYEILSGRCPYDDQSHNESLAIRIRKGFRPDFKIKIPKLLLDLICQCWDDDPNDRPKAKELRSILQNCENDYSKVHRDSEIFKQIDEADKYNMAHVPSRKQKHPQAFYTSRSLQFIKLPARAESLDEPIKVLLNFTIPDVESEEED